MVDVSAPVHSKTGKLIYSFFRYLRLLPGGYLGRISHGGYNSLILYPSEINPEDLQVCLDLFKENMRYKLLGDYFEEYIQTALKDGKPDMSLVKKMDNINTTKKSSEC